MNLLKTLKYSYNIQKFNVSSLAQSEKQLRFLDCKYEKFILRQLIIFDQQKEVEKNIYQIQLMIMKLNSINVQVVHRIENLLSISKFLNNQHKYFFTDYLYQNLIAALTRNLINPDQIQHIVLGLLRQKVQFKRKQSCDILGLINKYIQKYIDYDHEVNSKPLFFLNVLELNNHYRFKCYEFFQIIEKKLCQIIIKNNSSTYQIAFMHLIRQEQGSLIYNKYLFNNEKALFNQNYKLTIFTLYNIISYNINQIQIKQKEIDKDQLNEMKLQLKEQILLKKDIINNMLDDICKQIKFDEKMFQNDYQNLYRSIYVISEAYQLNQNQQELMAKVEKQLKFYTSQQQNNEANDDIQAILKQNKIYFDKDKFVHYRDCDFYLRDFNIILELDGNYHFYKNDSQQKVFYITIRNYIMISLGYKVINMNYQKIVQLREQTQQSQLSDFLKDFLQKDLVFAEI